MVRVPGAESVLERGRCTHDARMVAVVACLVVSASACGRDLPTFPQNADPLFYLALSATPPDSAPIRALLVTVGTPVRSEYRDAERFEMRRVRDGMRFAWRHLPVSGTAPIGFLGTLRDSIAANFVLDDQAGTGTLGRPDVVAGETYTIDIVTLGVPMHGQTTLPEQVVPMLDTVAGEPVVHWPPVVNAAGYTVLSSLSTGVNIVTTDTIVTLPQPIFLTDSIETIRVVALDANLFEFLNDPVAARAGIEAGFGVFGAFSEARVNRPVR